jgi:Ca2+-binding RTX toxin-like protein
MNRRLLTLVLAAPLAVASAAPAFASSGTSVAPKTCHGRAATIVVTVKSPHEVHGTSRADVVLVQAAGHVVLTGGGNDLVCGSAGADVIDSGDGNDDVYAGGGNDRVTGGRGGDHR